MKWLYLVLILSYNIKSAAAIGKAKAIVAGPGSTWCKDHRSSLTWCHFSTSTAFISFKFSSRIFISLPPFLAAINFLKVLKHNETLCILMKEIK